MSDGLEYKYIRMSNMADNSILNHLRLWILQLEEHHEKVLSDMQTEDDYQLGYIHGLNHGIAHLREQIPFIESKIKWTSELLKAQGVDEQGEQ